MKADRPTVRAVLDIARAPGCAVPLGGGRLLLRRGIRGDSLAAAALEAGELYLRLGALTGRARETGRLECQSGWEVKCLRIDLEAEVSDA